MKERKQSFMARGNPNPKIENLIARPRIDEKELCAPKPIQVKVLQSQYEAWMALPAEKRNKALREAIAKILAENQTIAS
jgi:hypothetical protein